MPSTKRPLHGLEPWSGIRNPDSMPYLLKRGIASLIWKENGESEKPYNSATTWKQFIRAYKIIGANLVGENRKRKAKNGRKVEVFLKPPVSVQGALILTEAGKRRERELRIPNNAKERKALLRARRAIKYLDEILAKLKSDLDAGVIKERAI